MKRGDWVRFDSDLVKIVELRDGYALIEFRSGARLGNVNVKRWLTVLPPPER